MALYLGAGARGSLIALVRRHSANGAGGALATCAFHALAYPRARMARRAGRRAVAMSRRLTR